MIRTYLFILVDNISFRKAIVLSFHNENDVFSKTEKLAAYSRYSRFIPLDKTHLQKQCRYMGRIMSESDSSGDLVAVSSKTDLDKTIMMD